MSHDTTHYESNGRIVCGTGRRSVRPRTTTSPFAVDCDCCRRTRVFKAAHKASVEKREAHRRDLSTAGFDPDMPVADMTPEQVQAFIEWRKARKAS